MAATSYEAWRSKLGNKYAKKEIEKWDTQLKGQLSALRRASHNRKCFECGADDCTWASPKLGIFICVSCSDVHRAAGAHITCVKNFNTYLWGPDEVELMKAVGNKRGKELYGSSVVSPSDSKESKVASCTQRYGSAQVQGLVQKEIALASERSNTTSHASVPAPASFAATETSDKPHFFEMPSQDLLGLAFVPDNLDKKGSTKIEHDSFLDRFDKTPPIGDLTSSISKTSSIPPSTNASSRAKEIFDDLEDFWANA
jgi:hypothetical protein